MSSHVNGSDFISRDTGLKGMVVKWKLGDRIRFLLLKGYSSCSDKSKLRLSERNWRKKGQVRVFFSNSEKR